MAGCLCVAATVTCCERKLAAINQLKVDNTQVAAIVCVLVRRNSLLVLDLRLHVLDRVRALNLEGDRLARQRLDEDLHRR
jgi:hypothetical protein